MIVVNHQNQSNQPVATKVIDDPAPMIAYWDKDLTCRFANAAYAKWHGRTSDEIINKIALPDLGGSLYEEIRPFLAQILAGKTQTLERRVPSANGSIRHIIANYIPQGVSGETSGFFMHVTDLGAAKSLESTINEPNTLISVQNTQLVNFANVVSHNLRSFSANLSSLLDIFQQAQDQNERDEIFGYLLNLSKAFSETVAHLTDLVSSQDLGRQKKQEINLIATVRNAISCLHTQIQSSKARIEISISSDLALNTNPAYLESILLNLLTNALKYSHPDRLPVIEVCARSQGKMVSLIVKDNGLGIDLTRHGRQLFGMNKTFHGNSDARGMGLFITKNQIEFLGGHIRVQSQVNQGTIFKITFPKS